MSHSFTSKPLVGSFILSVLPLPPNYQRMERKIRVDGGILSLKYVVEAFYHWGVLSLKYIIVEAYPLWSRPSFGRTIADACYCWSMSSLRECQDWDNMSLLRYAGHNWGMLSSCYVIIEVSHGRSVPSLRWVCSRGKTIPSSFMAGWEELLCWSRLQVWR